MLQVLRRTVGGMRAAYNSGVRHIPHTRQPLSFWTRLAACLSFVAVLSALLAPVSMLAQDVQTGKLGGVCAVNVAAAATQADGGNGDASQANVHCDLCGVAGLVLPPLPAAAIPCFAGDQVAALDLPANAGAAIPGLPFSRGPPASL